MQVPYQNERLRALVSGLPQSKRKSRRIVTFQAFIDDSGSGLPIFVLSGYISSIDWWESFSDEWQKLLDESPAVRENGENLGGKWTATTYG